MMAVIVGVVHTLTLGFVGVPPVQHERNDAFPPTVYVGGLFVYGERTALSVRMPYPGIFQGNVPQMVRDAGHEFYTASPGPITSNWDRAVTLFAELTGTRADYGIAHSERYNHARFGRDFSRYGPLVEGWSPARPVNLLGYSVGAQTIYLFAHLLAEGCAYERAATPADDLSPLFAGGNSDLIHSITSLGGTLNGSTIDAAVLDNPNLLQRAFYRIFFLIGSVGPLNNVYNIGLEHFGLSRHGTSLFTPTWPRNTRNFFGSGDHILYDLSPGGAAAINQRVRTQPDIYYFSYVLCVGYETEDNHWYLGRTERSNFFLFYYLGNRMGRGANFQGNSYQYRCQRTGELRSFTIDETWLRNDGCVNFVSARFPFGAPNQAFQRNNIRPGVWQVMPTIYGYHHGYFGGFGFQDDITESLRDFFVNHIELLNSTWGTGK